MFTNVSRHSRNPIQFTFPNAKFLPQFSRWGDATKNLTGLTRFSTQNHEEHADLEPSNKTAERATFKTARRNIR